MHELIAGLIATVFLLVGYVVGYGALFILTLDSVDAEPFDVGWERRFRKSKRNKWWHLTYRENGRVILPSMGVVLLGWLVMMCTGVAVYLAIRFLIGM